MHYMGFVFVDEPTESAVEKAMEGHHERHWDWYRCGGRWDGYFDGEDEMKRRETHDGFNFAPENKSAERNHRRVSELDPDKPPYFFVADGDWVPKKYYNEYEPSDSGNYYGAILETPEFEKRWRSALEKHKDKFAVVVDAHD